MLTVNNSIRFVVAVVAAAGLFAASSSEALARPKYKNMVDAKYPDLAKKHGTDGKLACTVCHPKIDGKDDKKVRNNYGTALGKALSKKNESDEEKIKEALGKIESEKSATEGKTFGDLIKDGTLPGTDEAVK